MLDKFEDYNLTYEIKGVRIPLIDLKGFKDENEYLRHLCLEGYKEKGINKLPNKDEYIGRVKYELETLKKLGFTRYILMIWDLIRWCDEQNIPRGFGRGSVAGSLIAYLIDMTATDPVKYGLIFERFINESRAKSKIIDGEQYSDGGSVPDIDVDVSYVHRERIIKDYLERKYPNRTAFISTLNTLSTKLVLKEVAKKYSLKTETEANKISSWVDSNAGVLETIDECLEHNIQFKDWANNHKDAIKVAKKLLGLPKNFGVHAAGIIISYDEIQDSLPLEIKAESSVERLCCPYTKDDVAEIEIKADVLGLKTVDLIYNTAKEAGFDLNKFDVDDEGIYHLLELFENSYGVFQLDGETASRVTKKVKPRDLEDVSSISAISRPGSLSFLDDFVDARNSGNIKEIYPSIDEILKDTGGVILYQEQIMAIANKVYGFSLVEADILRKIIGKKKIEEVEEWKEKIEQAGAKRGIPESATKIFWETVRASAKYSFNKSHSISYAYISILCAFLKVKYPAIFFKNCLMLARTFQNSEQRIMQICKELPNFGVSIKPPDLIKSEEDFTVQGNVIRYGLQSIKSVSYKTLEKIKQFNFEQPNKFKLFESAKESGITIAILKNLIRAGCLNSFDENRGKLVLEACTWNILTEAQKIKISKFGSKYKHNILDILIDIKNGKLLDDGKEIISTKKRTNEKSTWDNFYNKYLPFKEEYMSYKRESRFFDYYFEQDVLGFAYSNTLQSIIKPKYDAAIQISNIENVEEDKVVIFGGIVQEAKLGKTKKGGKMLTMTIADETGEILVRVFNYKTFDRDSYQKLDINNVDDIQEEYSRLPEKKDIVVIRGTKKGFAVFGEKIKILNEEYKYDR